MTRRSSRMPSHPRRPKRGRVPAPPPTLGPLITRPGRARHQHLARGSRLGQRAEPEGKGERERRGRRPRPGGCLEPRATHARPPRCGQERAGPQAGETPGPRRAAPEPLATWRRPPGHLSCALGAPPGCAPGASQPRPHPARTTRARPSRPAPLQTVGLRRRLARSLPAGRPPPQPPRGPAPRTFSSQEGGPLLGPEGALGAPGQPLPAPGDPPCARRPRQELGDMLINWFHYQPPSASRVHGSNLNWSLHLSW